MDSPLTYYSNPRIRQSLKELPDEEAEPMYRAFTIQWEAIERSIEQANDTLTTVWNNCKGNYDKCDNVEVLQDLLNKCNVAFEIREDHENKKIPMGHRLVIEAILIREMEDIVDVVMQNCRDFHLLYTEDDAANQREKMRMRSHHLTDVFFETHERFLRSYLRMPW